MLLVGGEDWQFTDGLAGSKLRVDPVVRRYLGISAAVSVVSKNARISFIVVRVNGFRFYGLWRLMMQNMNAARMGFRTLLESI